MPSLSVDLPAYTVAKQRKSGWAFYFQVPARLRPKDFPPTYRLPIHEEYRTGKTDAAEIAAVIRDANYLLNELAIQRGEARKRYPAGSIPWLIETLEKDEDEDLGWSLLASATQKEYSRYFRHLKSWSDEARNISGEHPHITLLDGPTIRKYLSRWKDRGRSRELMASAINKLYAVAIAMGEASPSDNPLNPNQAMSRARRKKSKKTAEKVLWPADKQQAVFDKCRAKGRWGLLLALGFIRWQTQRVEDAVHLHSGWIDGDWFDFQQSKTGKRMRVPISSEMKSLLDEVARERGVARIGYLAINENTGAPYFSTSNGSRRFNTHFRDMLNEMGPEYKDLQAQHLRHTGIIEMARAALDLHQIRTRTGHSYKTLMTIIEHYLPEDEQIALSATLKLEEYWERMKGEADV